MLAVKVGLACRGESVADVVFVLRDDHGGAGEDAGARRTRLCRGRKPSAWRMSGIVSREPERCECEDFGLPARWCCGKPGCARTLAAEAGLRG
jgi:hypothetical protein